MQITQIAVLPANANYNYILHCEGETVVVDPSLSEPVIKVMEENNWRLDKIINTHHHWDHTDGNLELKEKYNCEIYGSAHDSHRIKGITHKLHEGDKITICAQEAEILFLPGHTNGHIAYYFKDLDYLFSGDVLFSGGCGRIFEGTYKQAYDSIQKIASLPKNTTIFAAHEYTLANFEFALSLDPDNKKLQQKYLQAKEKRQQNIPTVPMSLEQELTLNPFILAKNVDEFAKIRKLKDGF